MNRALIFGIPLAALGVASWAAWQVYHQSPVQPDAIVMMLPGEMPALNPYLPATEAERQILDLLYEPMIRLDSQGSLAPGLASSWEWHQRVTCWYSSEESLQLIQGRLAEIPEETRKAWELEEVLVEGESLVLRFAKPGSPGVQAAMETLASEDLVPLTFARIDSRPGARLALEEFVKAPEQANHYLRLWFDEDGSCELVTTKPLLQVREALTEWLRQKNLPVYRVTALAEVAALLEPTLDFELNPNRQPWPDGSPVIATDIQASLLHVQTMGYMVQGREGFRHIQSITAHGNNKIRVSYRRSYGAALASWVGFPILQEKWLNAHPEGGDNPPGSGGWQAETKGQRLVLTPQDLSEESYTKGVIYAMTAASPLQTRVALATGAMDVVWPGDKPELLNEPTLDFHPTPAHNRLLVLWNLRSSRLSELPVREALAMGLDRESLLKEGLGGQGRLAEPLFAPGLWYTPESGMPIFDLAAARQRLETAGWLRDVSGLAKKGGQTLEFGLLVTKGNTRRELLARLLAEQWKKLGAQVKVTAVPSEALVPEYLATGKFDAVLLGLDYELAWDQTAFWHSGQIQTGLNFSQLTDPQLDLLLEALAGEYDTAQIPERARAVQARLLASQPVLPLIGDLQQVGLRKSRFTQFGEPDLKQQVTLRSLLELRDSQSPQMRVPNE
jgi:ABC-type transport system substrate-binding protein